MLRVGGPRRRDGGRGAVNGGGPLRGTIDALDALGLTPRALGGLAGASRLSRVAVGAGQSHAPPRQTQGGDAVAIGMRRGCVLEGTGEAQTFAVLADVPSTITPYLSQTTGRAGLARLLGRSVGRIGGGGISGDLGCRIGGGNLDAHVFHVHASAGSGSLLGLRRASAGTVGGRRRMSRARCFRISCFVLRASCFFLALVSSRTRRLMQFRLAMRSWTASVRVGLGGGSGDGGRGRLRNR